MDEAGLMSETVSDDIVLDMALPTGSINIAQGAEATNLRQVTLFLDYDDVGTGVDAVRFSGDGTWDDEEWETPAGSKAWELPAGEGVKTVWYQVRDVAGHLSESYSDDIVLDTVSATTEDREPSDGAKDVPTDTSINITFDEPMDTQSVEDALSVRWEDSDGVMHDVPGTITWNNGGTEMTFMPVDPLKKGSKVRVEVGPGAKDAAGNGLDPAVSYTFNTAGEPDDGDGDDGFSIAAWVWVLLAIAIILNIIVYGFGRSRKGPQGPE
jgi:hypothetical protein